MLDFSWRSRCAWRLVSATNLGSCRWGWIGIIVLLLGAYGDSAAAQLVPTRVILSGAANPSGGTFTGFSTMPIINDAGQVLFSFGTSQYLATAGTITPLAVTGTASPAGGQYSLINYPTLNNAGQTGFHSAVTGGSTASGTFVASSGGSQSVVLQGTASPLGGTYTSNSQTIALNDSGRIAQFVEITGGSATEAILTGLPGSLQVVAQKGAAAPAGGNYNLLDSSPSINASGQIGFRTSLTGSAGNSGIFFGAPGALQTVAVSGQAAPGGGTYNVPSSYGINDAGQIAIWSTLSGTTSTHGIFIGTPGALQTVARSGTAAPAGGNYDQIGAFRLNSSGVVSFTASLLSGSSSRGLFLGTPGNIQKLALVGESAPGGGTFSGLNSYPLLSDTGYVAFAGNLSGAGITTANDRGLYAGTSGSLQLIVREGDTIDVDPGVGIDLRTVANDGIVFLNSVGQSQSTDDGRSKALNSDGLLAYHLTFTNGTSGIFVTAIPEPGTIGLVTAGAIALVLWRRRRAI